MRRVNCLCGHEMAAVNDEELFRLVREHVDSIHKDDNYTNQQVADFIAQNAVTT